MKKFVFIFCLIMCFSCKKEPKSPKAVQLVYPLKSSECNTGVDVSGTNTSEVEFRWDVSKYTDLYELRYTNLNTNTSQIVPSSENKIKVVLEKGAPYSWFVTSKNDEVNETATSEIWHFYNAGAIASYAPFPAELISPKSGQTVFKDLNNEIELEWLGSDLDDNITEYDIYFSTVNPPTSIIATKASSTTTEKVSVNSNTVYYWKVVTKDAKNHSSDSGIYEFKVN